MNKRKLAGMAGKSKSVAAALTLALVVLGSVTYVQAQLACGKCCAAKSVPAKQEKAKGKAMEVKITKENFENEVLKSKQPVMVDFWATWCGPCRMLEPVVAEIANSRAGTLKVGKINVDEEPELAAKYGITGIPALLVFKDGKVVETSVGYKNKAALDAMLDKLLK